MLEETESTPRAEGEGEAGPTQCNDRFLKFVGSVEEGVGQRFGCVLGDVPGGMFFAANQGDVDDEAIAGHLVPSASE